MGVPDRSAAHKTTMVWGDARASNFVTTNDHAALYHENTTENTDGRDPFEIDKTYKEGMMKVLKHYMSWQLFDPKPPHQTLSQPAS